MLIRNRSTRRRSGETFLLGYARRFHIYFCLPCLFWVAGLGFFMYARPNLQNAVEKLSKMVPKDHPYAGELVQAVSFALSDNTSILMIVMGIFVVSLARIVAVVYHPFLIRTLIFSSLGTLAFISIAVIVNPIFHTLIVDYTIRQGLPASLITLALGSIICGITTEFLLDQGRLECGHRAGANVFPGTYVCRKCLKVHLKVESGTLPTCECKGDRYRREA